MKRRARCCRLEVEVQQSPAAAALKPASLGALVPEPWARLGQKLTRSIRSLGVGRRCGDFWIDQSNGGFGLAILQTATRPLTKSASLIGPRSSSILPLGDIHSLSQDATECLEWN